MNFNKDYPIAILDTNIVMEVPNILDILKGCNIVIPFTLIEELDNHKKENAYGVIDFVNNFLALSEKANLSKDGYKLENDCMLYLDIDKNNSYHKDINLDSKKQDIKFIAEAKNLKEKYNDMEVVLISSDKIMKITASAFDVKVKFLEEFIFENKNIEGLYKLSEIYNSAEIYKEIYNILAENKDIVDILYKLSESYNPNEKFYKEISNILANDKNINGLYELAKYYKGAYYDISNILAENKDIDGLYKLSEIYNPNEEVYKKISNILANDKNINGLYELA
ncbi:PIN domain-containing protein, partial [Brachyspira aalborgi]|uniref:PIN domain-containing protein n=1 Tax=Brachyspira aalborgi TaxID=29522 RepID=UPI00266D66F5